MTRPPDPNAGPGSKFLSDRWEESPGLAKATCKVGNSEGILSGDGHIYRRRMTGDFANRDVIVGAA